jgi:hypothetical protein
VATNGQDVATPAEAAGVVAKYELIRRFVPVAYILATALPIHEAVPIAQAFAGRQTNLNVALTAGITASLVLGGGNALQLFKGWRQGRELQRLRARVIKLETELKVLKAKKV